MLFENNHVRIRWKWSSDLFVFVGFIVFNGRFSIYTNIWVSFTNSDTHDFVELWWIITGAMYRSRSYVRNEKHRKSNVIWNMMGLELISTPALLRMGDHKPQLCSKNPKNTLCSTCGSNPGLRGWTGTQTTRLKGNEMQICRP